jgi:hypothetical protein
MAKRVSHAEEIAQLDETQLRERLLAAERVCVLFGWSPSRRREGPREEETYNEWSRWYEFGNNACDPRSNIDLNRQVDDAERRWKERS